MNLRNTTQGGGEISNVITSSNHVISMKGRPKWSEIIPFISLQYHRQVPAPGPVFFSGRAQHLPGPGVALLLWAGTRRNIHPLTPIVVINHPSSASSIYYDPWHLPCSNHAHDSLFPQSLSKFSLVYLLAWHPPLHTPYISSTNHCLLFTTHAHTIATCFAVCSTKIMSSNSNLSLNSILGTVSFILMQHIHLTILICACWSANSFSFLTGQVSLPCIILHRTQLP